jgi:hypothetical protein
MARGKPKEGSRPLAPDELIKTGKDGRIRLIEKRKPRQASARRKAR